MMLVEWELSLTSKNGGAHGYFPDAKKCWIITKAPKEERVRDAFKDTSINVTIEGHKHLGAELGSRSYASEYISEKVETCQVS